MARFLQIDENGFFISAGLRITDEPFGYALLSQLQTKNRGFVTEGQGDTFIIEAFDLPLVARHVTANVLSAKTDEWLLEFPYGYTSRFNLNSLCTDDWDRFLGRTLNNIPFVFSRSAQVTFFNLLEGFDDDAIYVNGKKILIPSINDVDARKGLTHADVDSCKAQGWDLDEVAKPLREVLPQIKIPRSRICILGCGSGHDAAYLASQGHIVTVVDLNADALAHAHRRYGETPNLKFVEADAFDLKKKSMQQFDVIFEHTFFCSIMPHRRQELVRVWSSLLTEGGYLLGIFSILDRVGGPPFGATEWSLKKHLQTDFDFLYWTRWKTSIDARLGQELIVYAQKKRS